MATPTTLAEARTAYLAGMSYRRTGSVEQARDFEEACMALLMLTPVASKHSGEEIELDPAQIKEELAMVRAWLQANDTSGAAAGNARFFSFEDFRS